MKKILRSTSLTLLWLCTHSINAQNPFSFANANSKFSNTDFHSGNAVSVVDMDGDGLDDIARLDGGTDLYYTLQRTGSTFTNIHASATGLSKAWGMVVADVNNDGVRDVAVGSGSAERLIKANSSLTAFNLSASLPAPTVFFPQNMNFADIDNDGWVDLFVCNDNAAGVMWANDHSGNFPDTTRFFSVDNPGTDNSGNYGSIWTDIDNDGDIDFYIAHCRQGTGASDGRRLDQLFINNGNGQFTLDAGAVPGARGLRNYNMTWTASFEDIDNDGDLDCLLTETDVASQLFLNDGNGYFTEITSGSGLVVNTTPYQSKMEDFDNDGYVDILISGNDSRIFHNNHDHTFTLVNNVFDNNHMKSFAVGDLNHDGKVDLYASYAQNYNDPTTTDDVLWLNTTSNNNHFITFNLQGTLSNRDALGARVEIFGPWGKQIREVRAGESYGTTNSFMCHFGIGTATQIDSASIHWPSGIVTHLGQHPADQFITVIEGQCVSPDNLISSNGPLVLCGSNSLTMNAAPGYAYLWSTGDTTASITISSPGEYQVRITDQQSGCSSTSKTVTILTTPDETPSITAHSELTFCEGTNVVLESSPAAAYWWSNGDTTQTTTVTQSGSYTVTIQGSCAVFSAPPVTVQAVASHVTTTGLAICEGNSTTLHVTASGDAYWFDSDTSGTWLATGTTYTTPVLHADATYYAESHDTAFGLSGNVGPEDHSFGNGGFFSGDQHLLFDVYKPVVLQSVKVYSGSKKDRIIQLRDAGGAVLHQLTMNIDTGEQTVALNWNIAAGTAYQLGWQSGSSPDLYRNSAGAAYPYNFNNLLSITGSSAGGGYYYAFYNWQVQEPPLACTSTRVPVAVTVYPNPVASFTSLAPQYYESDAPVILNGNPAGGIFSGAGVSGNTFDPAVAGSGGPYDITYTYTDNHNCSGSDVQQVTVLADTSTNILTLPTMGNLNVFPNPGTGQFSVRFTTAQSTSVHFVILNGTGQKIAQAYELYTPGSCVKTFDLTGQAKGIYQLVVTCGSDRVTYGLAIQ